MFASCSSGSCSTAKCDGGITFYVAEVAGSLARGTEEPLHICFDGTCHDATVTRSNVGGSIFVPFSNVGKAGSHDVTVTGVGAMHGEYKGEIASYVQRPNGTSCAGSCALATMKIGADGTITPGVPASTATTVVPAGPAVSAASSTTTG